MPPPATRHPPLTVEQILVWADAYHARTGAWPAVHSGPVPEAPGRTWQSVNTALAQGCCGLPGGSSLARLLTQRRGARNRRRPPPLTVAQILAWAEAHYRQTLAWPAHSSGSVTAAPGETWDGINQALARGLRGLPGGSTLFRLLAEAGHRRSRGGWPPLSVEQVRAWVEAYYRRERRWPTRASGPVPERPGLTWRGVAEALYRGRWGLPGATTLAREVRWVQNVLLRARSGNR